MRKTAFSLGKSLLTISISILLVALTACGGTPTPTPTPTTPTPTPTPTASATPTPSPSPTPTPSWVPLPIPPATPTGPALTGLPKIGNGGILAAPKPGVWPTSSINCLVDFTNMYIVARNATNVVGQGHVDFYLDMTPPTTAGAKAGVLPSPAPTGAKVAIADAQANIVYTGATYTFTGVSNGNHTFAAQLVQNDDTPFNPPIIWAPVQITVAKPAASPVPSPSPSPTTK